MVDRGWHLAPLQFPPALHMAFTGRHIDTGEKLIKVFSNKCIRVICGVGSAGMC